MDRAHLLDRHAQHFRQLIVGWFAAKFLEHAPLFTHQPVDRFNHVHRNANSAGLVGNRSRDRLADPPGCIGRKLEALQVVELLDGSNQADIAFLDEVEQVEATANILFRHTDNQPKIGFGQVDACLVTDLDPGIPFRPELRATLEEVGSIFRPLVQRNCVDHLLKLRRQQFINNHRLANQLVEITHGQARFFRNITAALVEYTFLLEGQLVLDFHELAQLGWRHQIRLFQIGHAIDFEQHQFSSRPMSVKTPVHASANHANTFGPPVDTLGRLERIDILANDDATGKFALLWCFKQLDAANLAQVHSHRVIDADAIDTHVVEFLFLDKECLDLDPAANHLVAGRNTRLLKRSLNLLELVEIALGIWHKRHHFAFGHIPALLANRNKLSDRAHRRGLGQQLLGR